MKLPLKKGIIRFVKTLYTLLAYQPLYNGLVFLMDTIPWVDAGIVVILFTVIVKLTLFPLSKKAVVTQLQMKNIEPELALLKEKYKDPQDQARKTMELYKEKGINPFMGFVLILIQLPIIIALYSIFRSGLPVINTEILYSFVAAPAVIKMSLLGLVDISQKSIVLALLAGISSFFQIRYSVPPHKPKNPGAKPSFQDDLARSMNIQMRFVFPILAALISYSISGAIALYWITSNLFTIGQELVIRKKLAR